MEMIGDPAAQRDGQEEGRSESSSVPQIQDSGEVVDDTLAAAEGRGC